MATAALPPSPHPVDLADVEAAAARIKGSVVHTPTMLSRILSERIGCNLYLKMENLQFTGAYKERGALNRLLQLDEAQRAAGVVTASAGNHAQALAFHAARLGIPATIVMPAPTPTVKVSQTQRHGATVVLEGETFDDAKAISYRLAEERGLTYVPAFDDPDVIAGQGTVGLEMLQDVPVIDTLVVPIGGGGLIAGCAVAAKALKHDIDIVGVQAELFPSMYSKVTGRSLPCAGDTIAEGIAVKSPGVITGPIIADLVSDILLVSERDMETAVSLLIQSERLVVEGAGGAGLAAMLANTRRFSGRNVGLVLTGGNIDTRLLATVLMRDLARQGRMARLRIQLQDRPGALYAVVRLFDKHQVNIVEITHQRVFTRLPAKDAFIDVECESRDPQQMDALKHDLNASGFHVHSVDPV